MTDIVLKLKCGDRTVTFTDEDLTFPLQDTFSDTGEMVTVGLRMKESAGQNLRLLKLVHELEWFNSRAVEYSEELVKEPVWLGMKISDGNTYDTSFGRGFLWKAIGGRHAPEMQAITYELGENYPHELATYDRVTEATFHFRGREVRGPHGERSYPWTTTDDRWIGLAQGAIRSEDYGGLIVEEGTTNLFTNSDFENEANTVLGWTCSASTLTAASTSDPDMVYSGYISQILANAAASVAYFQQSVTLAATAHSLKFRAKTLNGQAASSTCQPVYNGNYPPTGATTTFTLLDDNWYEVRAEGFTGTGGAASAGVMVYATKSVIVDALQVEAKPVCTSDCYGNYGRGYTFSGTAHQSTSVRAAAGVSYRNADSTAPTTLPRASATVLTVAKSTRASASYASGVYGYLWASGSIYTRWNGASNTMSYSDGTATITTGSFSFASDDTIYIFTRYGVIGGTSVHVYNTAGTLLGSKIGVSYSSPAINAQLWVGSDSTPANQWGGEIHEVQIWPGVAFSTTEMTNRVSKGRGAGELPYLWTNTGTGTITNRYDAVAGSYCAAEVGNVPGDMDAGLKLQLLQNVASQTPMYIYVGQQRRAVGRSDIPSRRALQGAFYVPFLEAEAGNSSYDANTTTSASADASSGSLAKTVPTTTTNTQRIRIPVCSEPEDLWKWHGAWRVIGRFKTATASNYKVQYRVTTGKHAGPLTPQFTVDANNVWELGETDQQVVTIPSWHVDPAEMQQYKPGDWASTTASPFCTLDYWVEALTAAGSLFFDGVFLLPQDYEAFATMPSASSWEQNRVFVMDTCSPESRSFVAHDIDYDRFHDGADTWNRFYLPVHEPAMFAFMWRRSGTGYPWTITDTAVVTAKYRPRYRKLR